MVFPNRNIYIEQIALFLQYKGLTVVSVERPVSKDVDWQISAVPNDGIYDLIELNNLVDNLSFKDNSCVVSVGKFSVSSHGNLCCGILSIKSYDFLLCKETVSLNIFPDFDMAISAKSGKKVLVHSSFRLRSYGFLKKLLYNFLF